MPLASFRITIEPGHPPVVEIDGRKLDGVEGVSTRAEHGRVPEVVLLMPAGAATVIEGSASITVAEPHDTGDVAAWLAALDPTEVERLARARLEAGYSAKQSECLLAALRELAGGG